ncbi:histone-lysine N-methyltransferase SETD1B-like isoform X2 [Acanthaster planci]|nr:histone-lysine N-methyltransferase SETD1B-like isoform X2 [Acanthaster planci]
MQDSRGVQGSISPRENVSAFPLQPAPLSRQEAPDLTATPRVSSPPGNCQSSTWNKEDVLGGVDSSSSGHSKENTIAGTYPLHPASADHRAPRSPEKSRPWKSHQIQSRFEVTEGAPSLWHGDIQRQASSSDEDTLDTNTGKKCKRDVTRGEVGGHCSHDTGVQTRRPISLVVKINKKDLRITNSDDRPTSLSSFNSATKNTCASSTLGQNVESSNGALKGKASPTSHLNSRAFINSALSNIAFVNSSLSATNTSARMQDLSGNAETFMEARNVTISKDRDMRTGAARRLPTGNDKTENDQPNNDQKHQRQNGAGIARLPTGGNSGAHGLASIPTEHLPPRKRHKRASISLSLATNGNPSCGEHPANSESASEGSRAIPIRGGRNVSEKLVQPSPEASPRPVEKPCKNDESQRSQSGESDSSVVRSGREFAGNGAGGGDSPQVCREGEKCAEMAPETTAQSGRVPSTDLSEETSELSPFTPTPSSSSRATPDVAASLSNQPQSTQCEQYTHLFMHGGMVDTRPFDQELPQPPPIYGHLPAPSYTAKGPINDTPPPIGPLAPPLDLYQHPQPFPLPPYPHHRFVYDPRLTMMPPPTYTTNSLMTPYPCHGDVSSQHGGAHTHPSRGGAYSPLPYQHTHPVGHPLEAYPMSRVHPPQCYAFSPYTSPPLPPSNPSQSGDGLLQPLTTVPCPALHHSTYTAPVHHPSPYTLPVNSAVAASQPTPTTADTTLTTDSAMNQPQPPQPRNRAMNPPSTQAPVPSRPGQPETHFAPLKRAPGRSRNSNHLSSGVTLGETSFLCEVCNKVFPLQRLLNRHMKCHSATKRYNCAFCSKGFNDTFDLKRHVRTHTGVRPYKCEHCSKAFTQRCSLESHLSKVHRLLHDYNFKQRRSKVFVCEECGATTEQAEEHYAHIRDAHPNSAELLKFQDKLQFQKLLRRGEGATSPDDVGQPDRVSLAEPPTTCGSSAPPGPTTSSVVAENGMPDTTPVKSQ